MNGDMFPEARVDPGLDLDRRYTTHATMDLCMRLAGVDGWDLDVAADRESHWAPKWFDVETDGLKQRWEGRVWCNPPFSDIAAWVGKAWTEMVSGSGPDVIAMLLPANRCEQPWWQELVESVRDGWSRDSDGGWVVASARVALFQSPISEAQWFARLSTYFLPGRVKFGHPGNRLAIGVSSPPFGCVLLVWKRS